MTRNPEDNRQWSSDLRRSDEDDDILSIGAIGRYDDGDDVPGADVFAGEFGDEEDSFEDEVDTIADELSRMGFHSPADFG
jgi:hypothetical protein